MVHFNDIDVDDKKRGLLPSNWEHHYSSGHSRGQMKVQQSSKATGKELSLDSSYLSVPGKVVVKARHSQMAQLKA